MGRGFKATFNVFGGKKSPKYYELAPELNVTGAYRVQREDSFGYSSIDQQKPRPSEPIPSLRPNKSTSNLTQPKTTIPNIRNSTPSISQDPRGPEPERIAPAPTPSRKELKNQEKEQKKLEKQRLSEQKAREKQAQEQARQDKLRGKAKKDAPKVKAAKNDKKKQAPRFPSQSQSQTSNVLSPPYKTNTLESSISKSSGPPPYSEVPRPIARGTENKSDNVSFSKPVDTGSWDIISQHRQQISRPASSTVGTDTKPKKLVMDLNYNFGTTSNNKDNSDA